MRERGANRGRKGRSTRRFGAVTVVLAAILSAAACTDSGEEAQKPRTEHERDSIIATTSLPGAAGVSRAMRAQDQANERNARLDSIAASIR